MAHGRPIQNCRKRLQFEFQRAISKRMKLFNFFQLSWGLRRHFWGDHIWNKPSLVVTWSLQKVIAEEKQWYWAQTDRSSYLKCCYFSFLFLMNFWDIFYLVLVPFVSHLPCLELQCFAKRKTWTSITSYSRHIPKTLKIVWWKPRIYNWNVSLLRYIIFNGTLWNVFRCVSIAIGNGNDFMYKRKACIGKGLYTKYRSCSIVFVTDWYCSRRLAFSLYSLWKY